MGAFGGGLGGSGEVCGAVIGALAVMGLRFSRAREDEREDPKMWGFTREIVRRFREEIVKEHKGILCRDIAGVDWTNPDEARAFYKGDKVNECRRLVGETAVLVGEIIERIQEGK
jgi:C_GCAxxG_C_C family probable redox protein